MYVNVEERFSGQSLIFCVKLFMYKLRCLFVRSNWPLSLWYLFFIWSVKGQINCQVTLVYYVQTQRSHCQVKQVPFSLSYLFVIWSIKGQINCQVTLVYYVETQKSHCQVKLVPFICCRSIKGQINCQVTLVYYVQTHRSDCQVKLVTFTCHID